MNNTKVGFDKKYMIHEKNSDMWVNVNRHSLVSKNGGSYYYYFSDIKNVLKGIKSNHPTWNCEVIEAVTETIEYEQVIEVNLEDENETD